MTKLFAVFGNPILHSKSPLLFDALREENTFYTRIKVLSGADVADAMLTLGLTGANITAPFKESALPSLDNLSDEVLAIGCTNTVVNKNGKLTAYNTDWYGATQAIKESGYEIQGMDIVLLGAGGAGKAVAFGLVKKGANVTIVNRTLSKAKELAEKLGCKYADIQEFDTLMQTNDMLVSTILPNANNQLFARLPKGIAVFDANYHNSELIKIASKQGNPIVDASQWLLFQGQMAYSHFLEKDIDSNLLRQACKCNATGSIVAVCNTADDKWLTDNIWMTSKSKAAIAIDKLRPKLVIYTPELLPQQAEELYNDERDKAVAH